MFFAPPSVFELALAIVAPIVLAFLIGTLTRVVRADVSAAGARILRHRATPIVAGVLTAAVTGWAWRSANEPPVVHDEQAYLLQAEIFATGRWTGEPPPIPEFFQQLHVFVTPRLAAKYPPGHSLMLVFGVWLGAIGVVPLVMAGVAGGLVFVLARETTSEGVAALAWLLWTTSRAAVYWRASYLSENTSQVLWLVGLYALLRWWRTGGAKPLSVVAMAMSAMYLVRPLTAVALSVPVVLLVLSRRPAKKIVREAAIAAAMTLPFIFLNFLWHYETLGAWLTNPYAEYSRLYFPFQKPGFGLDSASPVAELTPEMAWVGMGFRHLHAAHVISSLPQILFERLATVLLTLSYGWRLWLLPLFAAGIWHARGPLRFAAVSAAALVLGYLVLAHPREWTVYYAEVFPVFYVIAAAQLVTVAQRLQAASSGGQRVAVLSALACLVPAAFDLRDARLEIDANLGFHRQAAAILGAIPDKPALVFVSYPPGHSLHFMLSQNSPDFRTAPLWIVNDRGEANASLLSRSDRPAYRLVVDLWEVQRLR